MKYIILIIGISLGCIAAPAFPGEIEFKQHDGSSFKGNLKGDEYFSWVEDKQGNIIKFNNQSKDYEYAKLEISSSGIDLIPSGIKVSETPDLGSKVFSQIPAISQEKLLEIWKDKKSKLKYLN